MAFNHDLIERKVGLLGVLTALTISVAGFVQIVPLYFATEATAAAPGIAPYAALELEGRDIYIREGCYNCHSQMVRPLQSETERYGHYSVAGESVYDHPFQFGSKRTGPDLARVGGRYTDEWHRLHLLNPRDLVPESNMPGFPWLLDAPIDAGETAAKLAALRAIGVPYTDADIAGAQAAVTGRTEMDALIAYLQVLGKASRTWK
jgi:cytochrome c oxidase cbb3-type subunit II